MLGEEGLVEFEIRKSGRLEISVKFYLLMIALEIFASVISADVVITIPEDDIPRSISPYIYGKNNCFNDAADKHTPDSLVNLYRESGVKIFRENGGNNCTKYNWQKKLSSHPDWYNNVYHHDWDIKASEIQQKIPQAQALFALQLLGWAASNENHNFDCWNFDECSGKFRSKNYAGGVTIDQVSVDTNVQGDPFLYLENWPADSTAGILKHWFSPSPHGLGLDSARLRYWNMDNEPEIWTGTHDDIADTSLTAEQYMQLYFKVAVKARTLFPGIKLVGPAFTNEWQWWAWKNKAVQTKIDDRDTSISWVEYFIKRIAEEQKVSGLRLLDVIDFHFYPSLNEKSDIENLLQLHRVFYDTTYNYPKSNGIHVIDKKWGTNVQYFMFLRVNRWLDHYLGKNHDVSIGMTEFGAVSGGHDAMVNALNYASLLGVFGREGVEVFTPWDWYESWWEVLHLFSRYGQPFSIDAVSTLDSLVSAYPTIGKDTITIILVNRSSTDQETEITLNNRTDLPSEAQSLQLSNLPDKRTFMSHANNVLKKGSVVIFNNQIHLDLPSRSITAIVIPVKNGVMTELSRKSLTEGKMVSLKRNLLTISGAHEFSIIDLNGRIIRKVSGSNTTDLKNLSHGIYMVYLKDCSGNKLLFQR